MKVSKYILATAITSFIFAGCSEADEVEDNINETSGNTTSEVDKDEDEQSAKEKVSHIEETDDEALNAVVGHAKDIKSYQAILNLEGKVDNSRPEELNANVRFKEGEEGGPPSLHLKSGGEDRTFSKDGETFYHNGTDWVDISDSAGARHLYQVTYNHVVLSFAGVQDQLEKEKDGDTTVYRYDGESKKVFETFKQLFADNFGDINISTIDNSLEIVVNEKENLIKEIDYKANGNTENGPFKLTGDVEFDSFNSVGDIEIPKEARN